MVNERPGEREALGLGAQHGRLPADPEEPPAEIVHAEVQVPVPSIGARSGQSPLRLLAQPVPLALGLQLHRHRTADRDELQRLVKHLAAGRLADGQADRIQPRAPGRIYRNCDRILTLAARRHLDGLGARKQRLAARRGHAHGHAQRPRRRPVDQPAGHRVCCARRGGRVARPQVGVGRHGLRPPHGLVQELIPETQPDLVVVVDATMEGNGGVVARDRPSGHEQDGAVADPPAEGGAAFACGEGLRPLGGFGEGDPSVPRQPVQGQPGEGRAVGAGGPAAHPGIPGRGLRRPLRGQRRIGRRIDAAAGHQHGTGADTLQKPRQVETAAEDHVGRRPAVAQLQRVACELRNPGGQLVGRRVVLGLDPLVVDVVDGVPADVGVAHRERRAQAPGDALVGRQGTVLPREHQQAQGTLVTPHRRRRHLRRPGLRPRRRAGRHGARTAQDKPAKKTGRQHPHPAGDKDRCAHTHHNLPSRQAVTGRRQAA
ncbi:MAG: hypothetical protein BWZ02_02898 [Lentisphaerae bacterium ADurb.BinA184]|nr:MAG: hypothetical protein BWZ02_02898 [Lentisphaerae bacterium ADurb.BinA184]